MRRALSPVMSGICSSPSSGHLIHLCLRGHALTILLEASFAVPWGQEGQVSRYHTDLKVSGALCTELRPPC